MLFRCAALNGGSRYRPNATRGNDDQSWALIATAIGRRLPRDPRPGVESLPRMARYRKPTTDDLDFDTDEERAGGPRLSPAVQAQLGRRLRAFYEALALGEQPVPDRFIEIINRLDQGQPGSGQEKRS